jgi:tetratricopeptide (TPR) repeat protein
MSFKTGFSASVLLVSAVVVAGLASTAAQRTPRPRPQPLTSTQTQVRPEPQPSSDRRGLRPPALLVRPDEQSPSAPLIVERADYQVTVTGLAARTRATLVFRNGLDRVLDGEVVFPLPEGALVSGFALDVGGRMVDGVVVGAQEARVAFESEVRRRVDPGLVEWVQGNNFRTRVFPIPARGRRTVTVEYLSDLAAHETGGAREAIYELPLRYSTAIDELRLEVSVVRGEHAPVVRSGLANFAFAKWQDRYVAETIRRDVQPGDDLRIALPDVPRDAVVVETDPRGDTFFVVDDFPGQPGTADRADTAGTIAVAWDASFSRDEADRERDLRLLTTHLARLGRAEVQAIVFRNVPEAPRLFHVNGGEASALIAFLRDQPCDGATNLAALQLPDDVAYTLLFSDGLSTIGARTRPASRRPVYAISGDARADHARLRAMAEQSGGAYINLQRHSDRDALDRLGRPVFSLVAVDVDVAAVADLEPAGVQAVTNGRVRIAGRLLADEARLTLRYGVPGAAATSSAVEARTVTVRRREARSQAGLVAQLWAQQRMAALAGDPDANRADLVQLGQRFSIVTPGTSLLVLETLDQYLAHDVTPPSTWPELRTAYLERRRDERTMNVAKRTNKTERVVEMWQRRVASWEQRFETKPWRPQLAEGDAAGVRPGVAGRETEGPADMARDLVRSLARRPVPAQMAEPVAAPASPPADLAGPRAGGRMAEANVAVADRADKQAVDSPTDARIVIQAWNPDTPYLRSLRQVEGVDVYRRYLAERRSYGASPSFYLDCADLLFERGQRDLALRVLTNVAELRLEDARLLRVLAHRLEQVRELSLAVELFERVRLLRPEEPQSYRDLALALDARASEWPRLYGRASPASVDDYRRALALFADIVDHEWDGRFPEVEVIALVEANRVATLLERDGVDRAGAERVWTLDPRLRRALDFDVRVVLSWDTDDTDMDLWVVEPSGETCSYSNNRTRIGGRLSNDFTGGYGPEEYTLRRALAGAYRVKANFYGSRAQSLTGPTTVQATVVTDYGRPTEQRRAITLRLTAAREVVEVGAVEVGRTTTDESARR